MSVQELRAGFARLTEAVVPDEDPYGLLLRQHTRRRRRVRLAGLGSGLAALLATVLVGSGALGLGPAGPGDRRDGRPATEVDGYPVTSDWTWRLIESPTRGNLGGDRALVDGLTRAFAEDERQRIRTERQRHRALPEAKVLFVHDLPRARVVVLAYHSDSAATLSVRTARRGASVGELVRAAGTSQARVAPFLLVQEAGDGANWSTRFSLGLAPAGCTVEVAETATMGPAERGIRRTWRPAPGGDYVLDERAPATGYWQATCAGTVRHRAPLAVRLDEVTGSPVEATDDRPDPGAVMGDPPTDADAIASYRELTRRAGLADSLTGELAPAVRWSGWIPDYDADRDGRPMITLVGPSGPGPVLVRIGSGAKAMLALAGKDDPGTDDPPAPAASRDDWPLVATGYTNSADLVAVRLPKRDGGRAVLSDTLLVVGRSGAVSYSVTDQEGRVLASDRADGFGAALLTVALGTKAVVRARDAEGRTIASTELVEAASGRQMFGERFVSDW